MSFLSDTQREEVEGDTVGMGDCCKNTWVWHFQKETACKISNAENNLQHTCWILKDCNILLGQVYPSFLSLIISSFTRSMGPK